MLKTACAIDFAHFCPVSSPVEGHVQASPWSQEKDEENMDQSRVTSVVPGKATLDQPR